MSFDMFVAEFSTFLIGVTIVFLTLLLLIVIIKVLSKVVGAIENRGGKIKEGALEAESIPVVESTVHQASVLEDVVDELELVAVITVAIAASMGTTSDRLQVRSLRKITR